MKRICLLLLVSCFASTLLANEKLDSLQKLQYDSLLKQEVGEIIIVGNADENYLNESKALGSIDKYLEESSVVNMVKRGAYAWEPMLNGMSTERSIITIDGMQIFQACTDKMDPITSYVENTNLSKARIEEGQSGSEFGGTVAGSIDLIRKRSGFSQQKEIGGSVFSAYETNNKQQVYGATLNYSTRRYFADLDFTYRDAENYKAGQHKGKSREVNYSQFTKRNVSATTGVKLSNKQELEGAVIYDNATDVGYPGLPMDVSLAEALITSISYRYNHLSEHIHLWETKAYFNNITHIMDDSHRPIVPIRMDMPGWSKTKGIYSKISGGYKKHTFRATLSTYQNNSLAEMTMFPDNPNEKNMFMLTWPDVNTLYSGLSLVDNISLSSHFLLTIQGGVGLHYNEIKSDLGLNGLQLFYPDLEPTKKRLLKNLSSRLSYYKGDFLYKIGVGYGERAPSVSEGYGFYLLNINDNYDYVGNPNMKNEKSLNLEASSAFENEKFSAKAKVNYFYIMDYIVGKFKTGIAAMNISANGVKIYEQLNHASIVNTSLGLAYKPLFNWTFSADASYRYGQATKNTILPLIQPFSYRVQLKYEKNKFFAEASVEGSTENRNSVEFGETKKAAFAIANFALSKIINLEKNSLVVKLGVENLLDHHYSTFDNWFGIPRMGRNIYTNVVFNF